MSTKCQEGMSGLNKFPVSDKAPKCQNINSKITNAEESHLNKHGYTENSATAENLPGLSQHSHIKIDQLI